MTVCIAALCDRGRVCVVAADREVTIGFPLNIAFEHHERKIDALSDYCVAMSAGNALVAAETVALARRAIIAGGTRDIAIASEQFRDAYMGLHLARAEQLILGPRGITLAEFKATGAQQIPQALYSQIDNLFWNFTLNTDFILAGVDEGGAHISWVHYHGVQGQGWLERFDKLGYQAIGSGGSHAAILLSLTGQHRDLDTAETVYNVYCAKVNAEVAPGVGDATDMAVISAAGTEFLAPAFLDELEAARRAATERKQLDFQALFGRRNASTPAAPAAAGPRPD